MGSDGPVNITGKLYYQEGENTDKVYYNRSTITVSAEINNGTVIGQESEVSEEGLFTLTEIPRFFDYQYPVTIKVTDSKGVFLDNAFDFLLEKNPVASVEAGDFRLTTMDATIPIFNHNSSMEVKEGVISLEITDYNDGVAVEGLTVELVKTNSITGEVFTKTKTTNSGKATFTAPYGPYNAYIKEDIFKVSSTVIDLQAPTFEKAIEMNKLHNDFDMRVALEVEDKYNVENLDYQLLIKSAQNTTCKVSSVNKYCAYAQHSNDIQKGHNKEFINIKRLSVS